jgi:hypothetical protein
MFIISFSPFSQLRNSLIFDFFPSSGLFPVFSTFSETAFLDRGDFDAGDEGLFSVDLSVSGVQGSDAGECALADQVDQGAQPPVPAGQGHVMRREKLWRRRLALR